MALHVKYGTHSSLGWNRSNMSHLQHTPASVSSFDTASGAWDPESQSACCCAFPHRPQPAKEDNSGPKPEEVASSSKEPVAAGDDNEDEKDEEKGISEYSLRASHLLHRELGAFYAHAWIDVPCQPTVAI
eukprot:scaffold30797_cov32-Prasinocladus_malaysianus.AAC.1